MTMYGFFCSWYGDHRDQHVLTHSFPTRRSSDLNPLVVLLIAALFAGSSFFVFGNIRQEITPPEDRSTVSISVSAPNTVSLDFVRTRLGQVEAMLQPYLDSGEATSLFVLSGWGNGGFMTLTLAPWAERTRSHQDTPTAAHKPHNRKAGFRDTACRN